MNTNLKNEANTRNRNTTTECCCMAVKEYLLNSAIEAILSNTTEPK